MISGKKHPLLDNEQFQARCKTIATVETRAGITTMPSFSLELLYRPLDMEILHQQQITGSCSASFSSLLAFLISARVNSRML